MISTQPSPLWAALELTLGVIIIAAGLLGYIPLSSTPVFLIAGAMFVATGRNLWASIFAHGSMDTIGFLMIYFVIYPGL